MKTVTDILHACLEIKANNKDNGPDDVLDKFKPDTDLNELLCFVYENEYQFKLFINVYSQIIDIAEISFFEIVKEFQISAAYSIVKASNYADKFI